MVLAEGEAWVEGAARHQRTGFGPNPSRSLISLGLQAAHYHRCSIGYRASWTRCPRTLSASSRSVRSLWLVASGMGTAIAPEPFSWRE